MHGHTPSGTDAPTRDVIVQCHDCVDRGSVLVRRAARHHRAVEHDEAQEPHRALQAAQAAPSHGSRARAGAGASGNPYIEIVSGVASSDIREATGSG